ncbi:MAG: hypothetical protein ACUVS3_12805 [Thermodesulfobacteriota bacterium]
MNLLGLLLLGLILLVVQTTVFRFLGLSALRAPLLVPLVLFGAFRMDSIRALVLSFFLGYASDVYSGGTQGIGPLVMLLLCLAAQWMRRGLMLRSPLALGFMAGPFCLLQGLLMMGIGAMVEGSIWLEDFEPSKLLVQAVVLSFSGPILVILCDLASRWLGGGWPRRPGARV